VNDDTGSIDEGSQTRALFRVNPLKKNRQKKLQGEILHGNRIALEDLCPQLGQDVPNAVFDEQNRDTGDLIQVENRVQTSVNVGNGPQQFLGRPA